MKEKRNSPEMSPCRNTVLQYALSLWNAGRLCSLLLALCLAAGLYGCASPEKNAAGLSDDGAAPAGSPPAETREPRPEASRPPSAEAPGPQPEETPPREEAGAATLLYMGQGSLRIVTAEEKAIYIDPYSGDWYDLPADLILVTHGHSDHNRVDLIQTRNDGCRVITHQEALRDGAHQAFDLGYVTVEAVEAGYNPNHDVSSCVGYVLTFSGGQSVYVTGDTSTTQQMPLLSEREIDYAFFCCDGRYNMDTAEASACAALVGAKHSIPYHTSPDATGGEYHFDRTVAEQFQAEGRIILEPGEELSLE